MLSFRRDVLLGQLNSSFPDNDDDEDSGSTVNEKSDIEKAALEISSDPFIDDKAITNDAASKQDLICLIDGIVGKSSIGSTAL